MDALQAALPFTFHLFFFFSYVLCFSKPRLLTNAMIFSTCFFRHDFKNKNQPNFKDIGLFIFEPVLSKENGWRHWWSIELSGLISMLSRSTLHFKCFSQKISLLRTIIIILIKNNIMQWKKINVKRFELHFSIRKTRYIKSCNKMQIVCRVLITTVYYHIEKIFTDTLCMDWRLAHNSNFYGWYFLSL